MSSGPSRSGHERDSKNLLIRRPHSVNGVTRVDDRCLIFLHIPKTAGQTLHFVALRNYREHETIHANMLDRPMDAEMERIPLEQRWKARLLWGHMPYGVHEHMPRRCEYLTVVRDPVSRVISVYKHILQTPNHVLHNAVREGVGLKEYVESGLDEAQTSNSQTRQLSGNQFGALDRKDLEQAKRNLESFIVTGLAEHLEETFVLLRRRLRLHMPLYVTRNVSNPLEVPEDAVELILQRNELDLKLYAFAQQLLSEDVNRQGKSFRLEVSLYRALRPLSRAVGKGADLVRQQARNPAIRRLFV